MITYNKAGKEITKMGTDITDIKEEISELRDCFVTLLSPERIYLFGSYAEGRQNADSDFDFYIVINDTEENIADLTTRAYASVRKIKKRPLDILVGTKSRFNRMADLPSVENEVIRKGVLIYGS